MNIVSAPPSPADRMDSRVVLRDGTVATLRVTRPADHDAVRRFFHELSPESRRRRFFGLAEPAETLIDAFCDSSNPTRQATVVALRLVDGELRPIAVGSYLDLGNGAAEAAFAVDDAFQGKGLGTDPPRTARDAGRGEWISALRSDGPAREQRDARGVPRFGVRDPIEIRARRCTVLLSLSPTAASVAFAERRHALATATSMRPLLAPTAVAIVGASRDPGSVGRRILDAIVGGGFAGPVYPINPHVGDIDGLRCYGSVGDAPRGIDLAIVAVPTPLVLDGRRAMRGSRREIADCDHGRLRGGGRRGTGPAAGARRPRPGARAADGRTQLHGAHQHRGRREAERLVLADCAAGRPGRLLVAERRARPGDPAARDRSRRGALGLRQRRQQGRRVEQRPARVLGSRRRHRGHPALPRIVRQSAPVRAPGATDRPDQADRRGEGGPHARRNTRRRQPHRRPRRERRRRRRPVPSGGRDPRGHDRRDVRHRHLSRGAAASARASRGDCHQRRRARHPRGRRVRSGRADRSPRSRTSRGRDSPRFSPPKPASAIRSTWSPPQGPTPTVARSRWR